MRKWLITALVMVALVEAAIGVWLTNWRQHVDQDQTAASQIREELDSREVLLQSQATEIEQARSDLDDLRHSVVEQSFAADLREFRSLILERELLATEGTDAKEMLARERLLGKEWQHVNEYEPKKVELSSEPKADGFVYAGDSVAKEELLRNIIKAREELLLRGSALAERVQAEFEHEKARLDQLANLVDLKTLLPENEFELLGKEDLAELRRRYEAKKDAVRNHRSEFPGLDTAAIEEKFARTIERIDSAAKRRPRSPVERQFQDQLNKAKDRSALLGKLTVFLQESESARDAAIDQRERTLLAKRLSLDGSDRAAFARLQELTRGRSYRWFDAEILLQEREAAILQRAFAQSPDVSDGLATRTEELLRARMIDPVGAVLVEADLRWEFQNERRLEPAITSQLLKATVPAKFERWVVSHLSDAALLRISLLSQDQYDFVSKLKSSPESIKHALVGDTETLKDALKVIREEAQARKSAPGPSHPLSGSSSEWWTNDAKIQRERITWGLLDGPDLAQHRRIAVLHDTIRLARSRVPYLAETELASWQQTVELQACELSIRDLRRMRGMALLGGQAQARFDGMLRRIDSALESFNTRPDLASAVVQLREQVTELRTLCRLNSETGVTETSNTIERSSLFDELSWFTVNWNFGRFALASRE